MPIYEYKCHKCGQRFEALILSPSEKVQCHKCGSESVKRQLSTFAVSSGSSKAGVPTSPSCGSGGFS